MVRVRILVSPDGLMKSFEAVGHAGSVARGSNLACAAATALLRTAARACEDKGIVVRGDAGSRGSMRCILGAAESGWLRGTTDFLLRGLRDLREEFPDAVDVEVIEVSPGATVETSPGATGMSPGAAAEE